MSLMCEVMERGDVARLATPPHISDCVFRRVRRLRILLQSLDQHRALVIESRLTVIVHIEGIRRGNRFECGARLRVSHRSDSRICERWRQQAAIRILHALGRSRVGLGEILRLHCR